MTLMIKSWPAPGTCGAPVTGSPCDPCKPAPPPPPGNGGGPPPFTDGTVNINQIQMYISTNGQQSRSVLGTMIIWSAIDNIPPQGGFGVPNGLGPPSYGFLNTWVQYESFLTIHHPYDLNAQNLPLIVTETITATDDAATGDANNAALKSDSISKGNQAIAQANAVLGN
jgi:hypothetical protein